MEDAEEAERRSIVNEESLCFEAFAEQAAYMWFLALNDPDFQRAGACPYCGNRAPTGKLASCDHVNFCHVCGPPKSGCGTWGAMGTFYYICEGPVCHSKGEGRICSLCVALGDA